MASDLTISERIRSTLAVFLKQDVDTIKLHQSLRNDLGLNSVDTFELVFELEEAFNFEIPDQDFPKLTTVSEVIAYVEGRVKKVSLKRAAKQ
jgi:acyl carrier protein